MDKILFKFISINISNLLTNTQHGLIKHTRKSTTTNSINFTTSVLIPLTSIHQVYIIHTDFSKAFDYVHHYLLLKKLSSLYIMFIYLSQKLISSYLTDRS